MKNVEHKQEWTFLDVIIGDVQLRHFILLSVPISQQFFRLPSLYFLSFLEWPLKLGCTFCWQLSSAFEQLTSPESWKFFSCKYKLQSIFQAVLTLVIYHSSWSLALSVRILLFWLVKTSIVLLSIYVVRVGRVNSYKWKRLPVTG